MYATFNNYPDPEDIDAEWSPDPDLITLRMGKGTAPTIILQPHEALRITLMLTEALVDRDLTQAATERAEA